MDRAERCRLAGRNNHYALAGSAWGSWPRALVSSSRSTFGLGTFESTNLNLLLRLVRSFLLLSAQFQVSIRPVMELEAPWYDLRFAGETRTTRRIRTLPCQAWATSSTKMESTHWAVVVTIYDSRRRRPGFEPCLGQAVVTWRSMPSLRSPQRLHSPILTFATKKLSGGSTGANGLGLGQKDHVSVLSWAPSTSNRDHWQILAPGSRWCLQIRRIRMSLFG